MNTRNMKLFCSLYLYSLVRGGKPELKSSLNYRPVMSMCPVSPPKKRTVTITDLLLSKIFVDKIVMNSNK